MIVNETTHKRSLRKIKTATWLVSLIALAAILLAGYAFQQKRYADEQARLAKRNITEAMEQQQIALAQRNIADSSKEQALQQRELALESEKNALLQSQLAEDQKRNAELNRLEALKQQYLAQQQKLYAAQQTKLAESNAAEAKRQQAEAESQRIIANDQKQISSRLKELADSRKLAKEAVVMMNEHRYDSSKDRALEAYLVNAINDGPAQNSDIYDALNVNWIKSIAYKNQFNFHRLPVRCICGSPSTDIIFTADEAGFIYASRMNNYSVQKTGFYNVKEEIRSIAVSGSGEKLAVITAAGNGMYFKVAAGAITPAGEFKFQGIGKTVLFDESDNIIVATTKGLVKLQPGKPGEAAYIPRDGLNDAALGKSGILYVASGNTLSVYKDWSDLAQNKTSASQSFDAKITSIAIDNTEKYLAVGTYNGFVWLLNNKNTNIMWSRALHASSINDLQFSVVNGGFVQLASASADQTIKLTDVTAVMQRKYSEDVLTLRGHNKWIYGLCYAPGGSWLYSVGEDNKLIAWKPTTADLYKTLTEK